MVWREGMYFIVTLFPEGLDMHVHIYKKIARCSVPLLEIGKG